MKVRGRTAAVAAVVVLVVAAAGAAGATTVGAQRAEDAAEAARDQRAARDAADRQRERDYLGNVCSILAVGHQVDDYETVLSEFAAELYGITDPSDGVAKMEQAVSVHCPVTGPDSLARFKSESDAERRERADLQAAVDAQQAQEAAAKAEWEARYADRQQEIAAGALVGSGSHVVGRDMAAGTWRTTAGTTITDCYWERSTAAGGAIVANEFITAATTVTVTVGPGEVFTSQRCGDWVRAG